MKKRWWIAIAVIFLFIMLVKAETVSAQPAQLFDGTKGLEIQYPKYTYAAKDTAFTLHTHVFNLTDGLPVSNATTDCYLHLYGIDGSHIMKSPMDYDAPEFEVSISAANFSNLGVHAYIIWCNSSGDGGFASGEFTVTASGKGLGYPEAILYAITILLLVLFIFVLVMTAKAIPTNDVQDELGVLVGINWWKHAKTILYGVTWIMVALGSFIMSNIATAYLPDLILQKTFFTIFTLMMVLSVPMLIYWAIYLLVGIFRDREMNKLIYQGFDAHGKEKL